MHNQVDFPKMPGPSIVQTRTPTHPELSDHGPTDAGPAGKVVGNDEEGALIMPVPNGHDWVFSGHLKDQALFDLIEQVGIGYDHNGVESVNEASGELAAMAKKERTKEEKARSKSQVKD